MASPLLLAFTPLGSYCITANATIALHELGHGLGIVAEGGKVQGFYRLLFATGLLFIAVEFLFFSYDYELFSALA
jgi:hypothetical protein